MLAKALDVGDVAGLAAAIAALGTLVVYVVIAFYAKNQLGQAERIRAEQARPYVIAEFVSGFLIDFRIRNLGTTMAKNVRLSWDRWPESTIRDSMWASPDDSAIFRDGIPSLAPHQEITTLFDAFEARLTEKLPLTYTLKVSYTDSNGRPYEDEFILDLNMYLGLEVDTKKTINDVARQLERVADALKGVLTVSALDADRREAINRRWQMKRRFEQTWKQKGLRAAVAGWLRVKTMPYWPRRK